MLFCSLSLPPHDAQDDSKRKILDLIFPWEVNSPRLSSFHIALVIIYSNVCVPQKIVQFLGARNASASFIMVSPVSSIS